MKKYELVTHSLRPLFGYLSLKKTWLKASSQITLIGQKQIATERTSNGKVFKIYMTNHGS